MFMILKLIAFLKKLFNKLDSLFQSRQKNKIIKEYIQHGKIPWSFGYHEYKWEQIRINLEAAQLIEQQPFKKLPPGYGIGLDERIVEYPWIICNLSKEKSTLLDAGSTFNFEAIVSLEKIANKNLTIYTFHPESINYNHKRISYQYGDLRELPFKDAWFDEIVCQSTLEHIGMDNSLYGYSNHATENPEKNNKEFMKVVYELERCLIPNGLLLITVPFGKYEHHKFFQQFDNEMILQITSFLKTRGTVDVTYFQYVVEGWAISNETDCMNSYSFNPHSGIGKGSDGAAHCRSTCCIKFSKEK